MSITPRKTSLVGEKCPSITFVSLMKDTTNSTTCCTHLFVSIKDFHLANRNLVIEPNEKPIASAFFMVTEFSVRPDLIFSQSFAQDSSYGYGSHQESSQTMAKVPRLEVFQHYTLPMSGTDQV